MKSEKSTTAGANIRVPKKKTANLKLGIVAVDDFAGWERYMKL